jgi:hypothetical protein
MTQSSTDSSLVASLQSYIDACSGPSITLYEGHPAVLMGRARDAISTLERELEEARAQAATWQRAYAGEKTRGDAWMADAKTAEAKVARMGEALAKIVSCYDRNGQHQREKLDDCVPMARSALQSEKDREGEE